MSRFTWSGFVVAIAFVAMNMVFAQEPPAQVPRTPTPPTAQAPASVPPPPSPTEPVPAPVAAPASAEQSVSVTGCLREASATPSAAAGAAAAPPAAEAAKKTDATNADAKFVLADAVTSPADAGAGASSPKTYKLVANDAALTPHVGKKLELTGTIDKSPVSSASASPRLLVQSGKVLSPSCS
jgi:hypothetical protein